VERPTSSGKRRAARVENATYNDACVRHRLPSILSARQHAKRKKGGRSQAWCGPLGCKKNVNKTTQIREEGRAAFFERTLIRVLWALLGRHSRTQERGEKRITDHRPSPCSWCAAATAVISVAAVVVPGGVGGPMSWNPTVEARVPL